MIWSGNFDAHLGRLEKQWQFGRALMCNIELQDWKPPPVLTSAPESVWSSDCLVWKKEIGSLEETEYLYCSEEKEIITSCFKIRVRWGF